MGATAGPAHAHERTGETLACRYVCCTIIDFPSGCRTSAVGSHGSLQSGVVRLVSCMSGALKTRVPDGRSRFCWNSPFGTRKL